MLYSFVVPTRERHDVLKGTLASILRQTSPNFEIVVMDNASAPATRAVVEAFESPHIRYFRAPERLAMTDNWELALQHVSGDYVTFVGDDDGVLPDIVEIAEAVHKVRPGKILAWKPLLYFWPNCFIEAYRNLAHMHVGAHIEERNSHAVLKDVYAGRKTYEELPSLYISLVPRSLIDRVRKKYGTYFLSRSPDIASGLINAAVSETHLYSYRPLGIRGVSHHSTGTSNSFPDAGKAPSQLFSQEIKGGTWDHDLQDDLVGDFMVEVSITNELLRFRKKYLADQADIVPDMAGLLKWFCQAAPRYTTRYDDATAAIYAMAKKAGIPTANVKIPPKWPSVARAKFNPAVDFAEKTVKFSFYSDPSRVRDVADFADVASGMCVGKDHLVINDFNSNRLIRAFLFRVLPTGVRSLLRATRGE